MTRNFTRCAVAWLTAAAVPAFSDTKIATKYVADGQTSESVIYAKGERLRYDLGKGVILLRQCDEKRIVQLDNAAKTYVSLPVEHQGGPSSSNVSITDTGEAKEMFGHPARHLKMTETVEGKRERTETDGWYVDLNGLPSCSLTDTNARTGAATPGYPVAYTITSYAENGKAASTVSMQVTELATVSLDAAMFEIPAGYTEPGQQTTPKAQGTSRIGAAPMRNTSSNPITGTRAFDHLIGQLREGHIDVVPLGEGSSDAVKGKAQQLQCDYILYTDLAGVEKPTASKMGGMLRKAGTLSRVTNGDPYEARIEYQLVPVGGDSPTLASSAVGKTTTSINWMNAVTLASSMSPMFMMTRMMGMSGALNPAMMNALVHGGGYGNSLTTADPMMSTMSMFLRGANTAPGAGRGPAQNPTAADTAIAAALDQEAKAILLQLKK